MITTTPKGMVLTTRALAVLTTLVFAFCLTLVMGAAPAYAAGESSSANDDGASVTVGDSVPASATSPDGGDNPALNNDLEAASGEAYAGDDGTDEIYIGLKPVEIGFAYQQYTEADPDDGATHVQITMDQQEGVDIAVEVDYLRVNEDTYGDGDKASLPTAITEGMTSLGADDYFCVSWYYADSTPLAQGTYYSDLEEYLRVTGSSEGGSASEIPTYGTYDINPMSFIRNVAVYGRNGVSYSLPYNCHRFRIDAATNMGWSSTGSHINLSQMWSLVASDRSDYLFDPSWSGESVDYAVTAQATYVREFIDPREKEDGTPYNYVSHIVYASAPVVFHFVTSSVDRSTLVIDLVDETGNPVDLIKEGEIIHVDEDGYAREQIEQFEIVLYKKYKNFEDHSEDGVATFDRLTSNFVQHGNIGLGYVLEGSDYIPVYKADKFTAGTYKIVVTNKFGEYRRLVKMFEVTEDEITGEEPPKRTFAITTYDPSKFAVKFVDSDGATILLEERIYNENTLGDLVAAPESYPTKPSTDEFLVVFNGWEVVETGDRTWVPLQVVSDMTYKAVYKLVPREDKKETERVYASGGLFGKPKKDTVLSYGLTSSSLSPEDTEAAVRSSSAMIGSDRVLAAYKVDITEYGKDGSERPVTTGVGDLSLTFKVDGVSDGTKVKVVQIHESSGEDDPAGIFLHRSTVVGGEVSVTVDDDLSSFIITTDLEAQSEADGASGDASGGDLAGEPTGDNAPGASTPSDPSSEAPAANGSADTAEPQSQSRVSDDVDKFINDEPSDAVTRPVPAADGSKLNEGGLDDDGRGNDDPEPLKAAPAADDVKATPQTGDPLSPLVPVIVVVAAFALATRVRTRVRE